MKIQRECRGDSYTSQMHLLYCNHYSPTKECACHSLSKHQNKHINVQVAQGNAKLVYILQNLSRYNRTKKVYWINIKTGQKESSLIGQKSQGSLTYLAWMEDKLWRICIKGRCFLAIFVWAQARGSFYHIVWFLSALALHCGQCNIWVCVGSMVLLM